MTKKEKENLFLIFIKRVGVSFTGDEILEFIFSKKPEDAIGYDWEQECYDNVKLPKDEYIDAVGVIKTSINIDLLAEQEYFRYLDAIYGIISIGWQRIEKYEEYDLSKLEPMVFKYGLNAFKVEEELMKNDIKLDYIE